MTKIRFDKNAFGIVLFTTLSGNNIKRRVNMVLDTGATYSMMPWYLAEELGYDPASSKNRIVMQTANGEIHVPCITIDSIRAMGKTVKNCDMLVHDLPEASRVDGLIGLNFLKQFIITIDFKNGIIEIH